MTEIQSPPVEQNLDIAVQRPELGQVALYSIVEKQPVPDFAVEGIFSLDREFSSADIVQLVAVSKHVLSDLKTDYGKEQADKIIGAAEQSIQDEETAAFNPQVAEVVLDALKHCGASVHGATNSESEFQRVSGDELAFKQFIASNFLNESWGVTVAPTMYRLFKGKKSFDTALQAQVENMPSGVLSKASKILEVSPEYEIQVIQSFEAVQNSGRQVSLDCITREMAGLVGEDRVQAVIDHYLESPDAVYDYDLSNFNRIVDEGLVEPERVIDTILKDINLSRNIIDLLANLVTSREDLGETYLPKIQSEVMRLVADKDIASVRLQGTLMTVLGFSSNKDLFTPDFQRELAVWVAGNQPPEKIKDLNYLKQYLTEETFIEMCSDLVTKFEELPGEAMLAGNNELKDYVEDVVEALMKPDVFESLDEELQVDVASKLFVLVPHLMLDYRSYKRSQLPEVVLETMKKSLLTNINSLEEEQFVSNYKYILDKFDFTDQEKTYIERILVAKSQFVEGVTILRNHDIVNSIDDEYLLTIIDRAIEESSEKEYGYFDLSVIFKRVIETKGYEFAVENVLDKVADSPLDIAYLLGDNYKKITAADRGRYLNIISTDASAVDRFVTNIADSEAIFDLGEDELSKLGQLMIGADSRSMNAKLRTLKKLDETLHKPFSRQFKNQLLSINPIELFADIDYIPNSMFEDARSEIMSFIEQDPVAQQMPKYFAHVLRRLESMPEGTGAIVLAKEASKAYEKAKAVYGNPEIKATYDRLYDSAPSKKAKTELEAITYARILGSIGYEETSKIETIPDAQKVILSSIYKKLGVEHPTEVDLDDTEMKVGELYPFIVLGSSVTPGSEFAEHYQPLVQATIDGGFKEWKYRKESRQLLIEHSMLPDVTQEQYDVWAENTETESRDILLNDAASVSRNLQEALRQHANLFSDVEEALTYSVDQVHEKNKKALAEIGGKIKDVHIGKRDGTIGEHEAISDLEKLQRDKDEINFRIDLVRLLNVTPDEIRAGVLLNEKGNPTKTEIKQVIAEVLSRAGDEGAEALQQVYQMMESFSEEAESVSDIVVSDTDDFGTTLAIGANPVGSCQHYETGQFRSGLLSYFDTATKLMVVKGQNGAFLSRAVMRLAESTDGKPVLVLEPTYSSVGSDDMHTSIISHAKQKADKMGIGLLVPDIGEVTYNDIAKIKMARRMGTSAPYSYSDIFGGYKSQGEEKQKADNSRKLKLVS